MPRGKRPGQKGQQPLPFGKGKRPRARPVYSKKSIERAKSLHSLRKRAREITRVFDAGTWSMRSSGITVREDVLKDLRTLKDFLGKFNKEHGPGFDISQAQERRALEAAHRLNYNWGLVIADAKKELAEKKEAQNRQERLGLQ